MKKEKSWTRQDYESQYEYMIRGYDVDYLLSEYPDKQEAIKAAYYSYQAKNTWSTGWVNRRRQERFEQSPHYRPNNWDLPF